MESVLIIDSSECTCHGLPLQVFETHCPDCEAACTSRRHSLPEIAMPLRALISFVILLFVCQPATHSAEPLDANRIGDIAQWLPEKPQGVGPTIEDRAAWKRVSESPHFAKTVEAAEKLREKPVPELPDDLFLDFSCTGNRLRVGTDDGAVDAGIDTHGSDFSVENTEIHEKLSRGRIPIRLAVHLKAPVTSAQVTLTITPAGK